MAGPIENMRAVNKKNVFTYVPPTPPTELIESTSYTLDFAA
ncbi:SRCR domain-containing protein, partial [Aphis craccivora]